MIKTLQKTLAVLALAVVVSIIGLGSGAVFEAAIAPDQVRADCVEALCDGEARCVHTSDAYNCEQDEDSCVTWECGVE